LLESNLFPASPPTEQLDRFSLYTVHLLPLTEPKNLLWRFGEPSFAGLSCLGTHGFSFLPFGIPHDVIRDTKATPLLPAFETDARPLVYPAAGKSLTSFPFRGHCTSERVVPLTDWDQDPASPTCANPALSLFHLPWSSPRSVPTGFCSRGLSRRGFPNEVPRAQTLRALPEVSPFRGPNLGAGNGLGRQPFLLAGGIQFPPLALPLSSRPDRAAPLLLRDEVCEMLSYDLERRGVTRVIGLPRFRYLSHYPPPSYPIRRA